MYYLFVIGWISVDPPAKKSWPIDPYIDNYMSKFLKPTESDILKECFLLIFQVTMQIARKYIQNENLNVANKVVVKKNVQNINLKIHLEGHAFWKTIQDKKNINSNEMELWLYGLTALIFIYIFTLSFITHLPRC